MFVSYILGISSILSSLFISLSNTFSLTLAVSPAFFITFSNHLYLCFYRLAFLLSIIAYFPWLSRWSYFDPSWRHFVISCFSLVSRPDIFFLLQWPYPLIISLLIGRFRVAYFRYSNFHLSLDAFLLRFFCFLSSSLFFSLVSSIICIFLYFSSSIFHRRSIFL